MSDWLKANMDWFQLEVAKASLDDLRMGLEYAELRKDDLQRAYEASPKWANGFMLHSMNRLYLKLKREVRRRENLSSSSDFRWHVTYEYARGAGHGELEVEAETEDDASLQAHYEVPFPITVLSIELISDDGNSQEHLYDASN